MEWLTKLVDILKIPVRIVLPSAWIFSGALAFVKDNILSQLGLLAWRNEHKLVLGLVFLISSCLILVYILWFLADKIKSFVLGKTLYYRTACTMKNMSDAEIAILITLYNAPDYTKTVDCGHPVVQGLIAQHYVHMGTSQLVSADRFTGAISGKVTLQPRVYRTFNHYKPKLAREIASLERKLSKTKKETKRQTLNESLADLKEKYYCVYEGGINNG